MATLAPELLHLIVSQVARSDVYDPKQGELKKDLGTLRSLRLASRKLSEVASEYLFEEITLYFTEASHAKMMAIAQHPTYCTYVRTLGISPKAIFGPFLDRAAFGEWIHRARPLVLDDVSAGYFHVPQRMAYLYAKVACVMDFHHTEYTLLYNKQEDLFLKAGDLLKIAIGRFSRLERVEPSVRTPPTAYAVPSTDDAFISDSWQDSVCLDQYDLDHAVLILTAVSQGRSLAGTQTDVSEFFTKMDTMVMDVRDPVAAGQIRSLVADTKKLNFSIQTSHFVGLEQLLNTGKCASFLGLMKDLESLKCSTWGERYHPVPMPFPRISDIFRDNSWRNLRHLELGRFFTTASELEKLFSSHRSTLQEICLQHILLYRGSWRDVFIQLRRSALSNIMLHHLGSGDHVDLFFGDIDEVDLDPLSSSHPIHAFLFRGASWVPYMDDVLEDSDADSDDAYIAAIARESSEYEDDYEESEEEHPEH